MGLFMQELKLDLEHCWGTQKLEHSLDFTECKAAALHAPNGSMTSSLARPFQDIANRQESSDRMLPDRPAKRSVIDENDDAIDPESVLIIQPHKEPLASNEKTSTLLANAGLRENCKKLNEEVEEAKSILLSRLKDRSGSGKDLEAEISSAFTRTSEQFLRAIDRVAAEVKAQAQAPFAEIPCDLVFDPKVVEMLRQEPVREALEGPIKRFNELDRSQHFTRGAFTCCNAGVIAKALADNGFFDAAHSVRLHADEQTAITSKTQPEELIRSEREGIASDATLRNKFDAIEQLLNRNISVRKFSSFLSDPEDILPALANVADFKEHVWKSCFARHRDAFEGLGDKGRDGAARQREIEAAARKEQTAWQAVIDIVNERFFVPFELTAENFVPAVLNEDRIPKLGLAFRQGNAAKDVDKDALLEVLGTGERRAFCILNTIFAIEVRKKAGQRTPLVVDGVADSFDGKNRHASIQYLKGIAEDENFRQVVLTHNFDFFRTIQSRSVNGTSCFMVTRQDDGIAINRAVGITTVFVQDGTIHFGSEPRKRIASLPFMRNLVEFTKGDDDPDFVKLTALLPVKASTATIQHSDLFDIDEAMFGASPTAAAPSGGSVVDLILQEADGCLEAGGAANLANKIVPSIAARLRAEQHMLQCIDGPELPDTTTRNQTTGLVNRFRRDCPDDAAIPVLDRIVRITPANIHPNSFMHEPILDMSDEHLRKTYSDVKALGPAANGD